MALKGGVVGGRGAGREDRQNADEYDERLGGHGLLPSYRRAEGDCPPADALASLRSGARLARVLFALRSGVSRVLRGSVSGVARVRLTCKSLLLSH